jgi:hypothetical protein
MVGTLFGHSSRQALTLLAYFRRAIAAIGHVHYVHAGHPIEQFAGQVGRAAVAGGRHVDPARISLGIANELGNGLGWNRWVHHDDIWLAADGRDRRDVADEIEAELVVKRGIDGIG